MPWMAKWAGGFPLTYATAAGNLVTDLDGHAYVDFALGDTGAMAGHSPGPTVGAIMRRAGGRRRADHDAAHRGRRLGRAPSWPAGSACRGGRSR